MAPPNGATLAGAHRWTLAIALGAVTLAGWWWLTHGDAHEMHRALLTPDPASWAGAHAFAAAVGMWMAMAAAMMTPTVWNWFFTFLAFVEGAGARRMHRAAAAFLAGYFTAWLAYSMVGASLQALTARAGWAGHNGRLPAAAAGAILIAGGLIHFSPLSRACLSRCRNPLPYFTARWRSGPPGGFRTGLAHGADCVGCCWALMLTGFAMGVMNLEWMAALTAIACAEKLAPRGEWVGAGASAGLVVWGAALLVTW